MLKQSGAVGCNCGDGDRQIGEVIVALIAPCASGVVLSGDQIGIASLPRCLRPLAMPHRCLSLPPTSRSRGHKPSRGPATTRAPRAAHAALPAHAHSLAPLARIMLTFRLWRGFPLPLITISIVRTISFSIYSATKRILNSVPGEPEPTDSGTGKRPWINLRLGILNGDSTLDVALTSLLAGAASGAVVCVGSAPFELVKVSLRLSLS